MDMVTSIKLSFPMVRKASNAGARLMSRARIFSTRLGTLTDAVRAVGPPLLFGVRLWVSVCLALYIAFWLELDNAYWAGTTAALVCQPRLGASLRKGWYRMIGTLVGAVAIVMLTACFPQQRAAFLAGLALWCAACALVSTLLRNFAAYSAALAGYTAAIIASDQLGATGGLNGDAFMLAVTRASEICIGIVCAGLVLAGTDFGAARRRLAELLAALSVEIACRFTGTLVQAGSELSQTLRRDLIRRVVALDPVMDETIGESSRLRYHSPTLRTAMDGLFSALAGWRAVAVRLARLPYSAARQEAHIVLQHVPQELQSKSPQDMSTRWMADPILLRQRCDAAVQALIALRASTPSLRLLSDQTAEVLAGMSDALEGLALLVADPGRSRYRGGRAKLRVPDWLPALINAWLAFITICAVEVFWIVTAWPNGAVAITWTAISVVLFATTADADETYASAMKYMVGTGLAAVWAAIIAFAVLPRIETFEGFSAAIGLYLVPLGALIAQAWQAAIFAPMVGNFVPLLAPANQMSYDTVQFYNAALAIVAGCGAAALSFRVLPPLSPAMRTRRLVALTLRDLRRLATSSTPAMIDDWEQRIYSRLAVLPDQAEPLQRAQLVAALSVGKETIRLRRVAGQFLAQEDLGAALAALAKGNTEDATRWLAFVDRDLATASADGLSAPDVLRARASILVMSDALSQDASYFGAGART
jgi:uncharacterized membrane protein YccC